MASTASQPQAPVAAPVPNQPLPEDGELEADHDSTFGSVDCHSETTSLNSSAVRGYIENGRRYQTVREGQGQYFVPSDNKQLESIQAGHLAFVILKSQRMNPLFRSPINEETVQNILDLGTGDGAWAVDVADRYPQATVRGVDLAPPPNEWVPANCILEGSFSFEERDKLYKRSYDNLEPGGWFEQAKQEALVKCDDGSAPDDAPVFLGQKLIEAAAAASGNPTTVYDEMRARIEKAGFITVQEKVMKMPFGDWPKHPVYKDAGRCNKIHYLTRVEGWTMWLMTKFGHPATWSVEETQHLIDQLKADMNNPRYHLYQNMRIVWVQRPYDTQKVAAQKPVVEDEETA